MGRLESAMANLIPGSYTAVVRGAGNTTGTGLVDGAVRGKPEATGTGVAQVYFLQ